MANGSKISASQLLEHFMFDAQMQYTYVSKLSGGEKRRLYLLTVLMKNPNFLILDEPTNDLDLLTLNKLEEFLLEFKGCLILVSHDRYFMDKLTDHLFVFKGAGVVEDHYCSYSELRNKQIKELKTNKKEEKGNKLKTKDTITFTEKKEYKSLEKQISKLELEKSNLEASFKDTTMDYELMMKKSKEKSEFILIATVGKSKGLKGEFFLNSLCDPKENILNYSKYDWENITEEIFNLTLKLQKMFVDLNKFEK